MDTDSTKVFQPLLWVKILFASIFLVFQIIIAYTISDNADSVGVSRIQDIIFMESFALVVLLSMLQVMTEKILITRNAIVRTTIYRKQIFSLNTIRLIKKVCVGRGSSALLIKTDRSTFKIGKGLTESQVNEAVSYILEQVRMFYPETYALMKDERSEVKAFWRK